MPVPDPRVAIVMITWNRREQVLDTLARLTRLPEQPPIVMVDNGSSDGTPAAVAERFPQVRVHLAGGNLGAAGRTLGVKAVDAPYVAFCDDDTWWDPGDLARGADLFDAHPRLALITARVLVGPEEREDPTCAEMLNSPLPVAQGMPGKPLLGFLAGASMVRRSAFLEAGGFRGEVLLGGEEEWLAVDLAARGWWLCYVPELTVHHHPCPQRDGSRRWRQLRNALWFAWLRRPFGSAIRRTFELAREQSWDWATLKGFASALAGLPWQIRLRRVVPPRVEEGLHRLDRARTRPATASTSEDGHAL
jgi:GT2 family glycosyltransferase